MPVWLEQSEQGRWTRTDVRDIEGRHANHTGAFSYSKDFSFYPASWETWGVLRSDMILLTFERKQYHHYVENRLKGARKTR